MPQKVTMHLGNFVRKFGTKNFQKSTQSGHTVWVFELLF